MEKKKVSKLIISLVIPGLVGFVSSIFTMGSISTWYADLIKPAFTPPDWIFAPVWTGLYVLMGFALYEVWISKDPLKKRAIFHFIAQLFLNGLWSVIFFNLHHLTLAFLELLLLFSVLVLTAHYFYRIFKPTIWLLLPYIIWLIYAGALNLEIVLLN